MLLESGLVPVAVTVPLQYAVTVNVDSMAGWLADVVGPCGCTCPAHPAEARAPIAATA
jgi:hypothetical protein